MDRRSQSSHKEHGKLCPAPAPVPSREREMVKRQPRCNLGNGPSVLQRLHESWAVFHDPFLNVLQHFNFAEVFHAQRKDLIAERLPG